MVCDPGLNNLNVQPIPPLQVPGFGIPFGIPQIPFPDISLPEGIPEDILDLIRNLLANIPGGPLTANMDNFARDILDVIASLLNQLGPYLALYRFLQALLNIILCIIDVLCASANPFKMLRALRRLFKRCLPDFLNLFPWLALLAMIIALLLLLLALIEYLINQILALLRDIIENLIDLASAVGFADSSRQLAGARKIAQLLCLVEQLFAILVAFQAILAIINALAQVGGRSVCGKKGSSQGEDFECCTDDVCPPFIFNNPDGLVGVQGQLIYHKQLNNDLTLFPGIILPAVRDERWQFFDVQTQTYNFSHIITPIEDSIFWPEGRTYDQNATVKKLPYILDMRIPLDPTTFGHTDPVGGLRYFMIKDIVVTTKPTNSYLNFENGTVSQTNGVLRLEGGKVYEDDGTTPFLINNVQANLNAFIHQNSTNSGFPAFEDGYIVDEIEYTLRINHPALIQDNLITMGCDPSLQIETDLLNSTLDITDVLSRIGQLPDIDSTLSCLNSSIARMRENLSVETVQAEQEEMVNCLNNLRDQTLAVYKDSVIAGTSRFNTTVELSPDVQFVDNPIQIKVTLKDPGGTTISFNVPDEAQDDIASRIVANATLGTISTFEFDGYEAFIADLTSETAGEGELTVTFDEQVLAVVLNRDNDDVESVITDNVQAYTFVGGLVRGVIGSGEPVVRRDERDVTED